MALFKLAQGAMVSRFLQGADQLGVFQLIVILKNIIISIVQI